MNKIHIFLLCSVVAMAGCATVQSPQAGISQFVEERDGKESVWGIDIQLDRLSFKSQIEANEIKIVDAKYNHNLKNIMTWSVSSGRKCLQIRFKPGMGDFGTGNGILVQIQKSSFEDHKGLNNRYEWSILTDIQ